MSEFYGCNEQLIEMINVWADIQKNNKPCWINIVEETGVGKTRLVQEFYKCLSDVEYIKNTLKIDANYNPEGYWPESLPLESDQLGINPDFNQINLLEKCLGYGLVCVLQIRGCVINLKIILQFMML